MGGDLDGRADQYALAATAFHLLTGPRRFQHSNPAVVISQHLSAAPPVIGDRRPELAALDPVFAKALAKDPRDRYERCADFARALRHRLGQRRSGGDAAVDRCGCRTASCGRSPLRAGVLVPAVLAVLLVVGRRIRGLRADPRRRRARRPARDRLRATATPRRAAPPSAPNRRRRPRRRLPPRAVIGADCAPAGSTCTTADGATAYCSTLQGTSATIWSSTQGEVPSPTVTIDPTETPTARRAGDAASGCACSRRARAG